MLNQITQKIQNIEAMIIQNKEEDQLQEKSLKSKQFVLYLNHFQKENSGSNNNE